jgi:hypothetical protein
MDEILKNYIENTVVTKSAIDSRQTANYIYQILLEIGTSKTTIRQIKQSFVNYRYGLLVSHGIKSPNLIGDCIQIPLSWFLLL